MEVNSESITLETLPEIINLAKQGDASAQEKLSKVFSEGKIIQEDLELSDFWGSLSRESANYRDISPVSNKTNFTLSFLPVENDFSRELNITPLYSIESHTEESYLRVEEHKKRNTFTYVVKITEYDTTNEMLAMMGVRAVFGCTSSEVRTKLASLPCMFADLSSKADALLALEELKKSSVSAEVRIINGFGEDVTPATPQNESTSQLAPKCNNTISTEPIKTSSEAPDLAKRPKFCKKCGSPLKPTALFCNNCGNKVVLTH